MNGQPSVIRAFIAIDVPRGLKEEISAIQRDLSGITDAKVSWAKPDGIHLTLKFLGDVDKSSLQSISSTLKNLASRYDDFTLKTTIRGGFPKLSQPKTIWIGVEGGSELISLRNDLELEMKTLGFPQETGRFHPHLTVGRIKYLEANSRLVSRFLELPLDNFEWRASRINLMSSLLKPTGAEYSVVDSADFI